MYRVNTKQIVRLLVLLSIMGLSLQPGNATVDNNDGPDLPDQCSSIAAPYGTKLAYHVFANGVQINHGAMEISPLLAAPSGPTHNGLWQPSNQKG